MAEEQATGSIFVIWVVFDDLTRGQQCLLKLGNADIPTYALVYCVPGELVPARTDFCLDFSDHVASSAILATKRLSPM